MTIHTTFPPPLTPVSGRYDDVGRLLPPPPPAPNETPLQSLVRLRDEAAFEIERLLTFLDETDGHPDLEDDDPLESNVIDSGCAGSIDECEPDQDFELDDFGEDDDPAEPSLGALNEPTAHNVTAPVGGDPNGRAIATELRYLDQTRWAWGGTDDAELDDSDREPSLGSIDRYVGDRLSMQVDQSMWSAGATDDRELEPLSV